MGIERKTKEKIKKLVGERTYLFWAYYKQIRPFFPPRQSLQMARDYVADKHVLRVEKIMDYLKQYIVEAHYAVQAGQKEEKEAAEQKAFVFWYQGREQMPPIVKACVQSIERHIKQEIVFLDKNNLDQYVTIPDYIEQKMREGKISLTHYSEILRAELLYRYGGAWIDATYYFVEPFDLSRQQCLLYTLNNSSVEHHFAETKKTQWTLSFWSVKEKKNALFAFLREAYFAYWRNEDRLIDYFLLDFFIELAYRTEDEIHEMLDAIPLNNPNYLSLEAYVEESFDDVLFGTLSKDTSMFKINRRFDEKKHADGDTFYHRIIKGEL